MLCGWWFYNPMPAAVSAVTDIQRALNVIRSIERDAAVETRLAALALITGTAADIARELRAVDQRPQKRAAGKGTSRPKPVPVPKPQAAPKAAAPDTPISVVRKPRPFTEPELASSPIETL